MTILCLVTASCANVFGAISFPGPMPTLIDLYSRAELVIHANVIKTDSTRSSQTSRLKLISVIKSDKRKLKKEIDVIIPFGSHWPRLFEAKRKTITFLEFDKEEGMYTPIASMTGLDVDDDSLGNFYVEQFAKLPKILSEKDARKLLRRKVQWYVDVVLFPQARHDGAFGISALWYRASRAKLLTEAESQSESHLLTKKQKESICRTLAKETPESNAARIVELLRDYPSQDLDYYLVQSFKRSMMFEKAIPITGSIIPLTGFELLPERLGFEVPEELKAKYEDFEVRRKFYIRKIHNKNNSEYTETEKAKINNELIRLWREVATKFLNIPEVAKFRKS